MTEWEISLIFTLKILLVGLFSVLYMLGGRSRKWLRRFVGSSLLGIGIIGFSLWQQCFSYAYIAYPFLLMITLSMGYGGDTLGEKIRRRFIYGLCLGLTCLAIAIPNGAYLLAGIQIGLCILISILFGVFNPFGNAVDEEGLIAMLSVILVPYMLTIN